MSGADPFRPPRIAQALLALLIPADDREAVMGDYHETLTERVRGGMSLSRARNAYRAEVVRAAAPALAWRLARLRRARRVRDARVSGRGDSTVSRLVQDGRFAGRGLRRSPGYAVPAVLTLTLAIGANTAVFSLIEGVLLRALPFDAPDRLVTLSQQWEDGSRQWVSGPDFESWRDGLGSFSHVVAYSPSGVNIAGTGEPIRAEGLLVSPDFFEALGTPPALGRSFSAEEGRTGGGVVLTDGLRRRLFGDASPVGSTLRLDGRPLPVVGVLPESFRFPGDPELFTPLTLDEEWQQIRGIDWLRVLGRLDEGVGRDEAAPELAALAAALGREFPDTNGTDRIAAVSFTVGVF